MSTTGYANTTQQAKQQAVMASTAKAIDGAITFDRYIPLVGLPTQTPEGQAGHSLTCTHGTKNGHITLEAATGCALALAEAELMALPEDIDQDAKLAAVAVTITTKPRYIGVKPDGTQCEHTRFGHKTLAQAQACTGQAKAKASKATRSLIQVMVASQSQPEASQAEATPEVASQPETKPESTVVNSAKPEAKRLRSGSKGQTKAA